MKQTKPNPDVSLTIIALGELECPHNPNSKKQIKSRNTLIAFVTYREEFYASRTIFLCRSTTIKPSVIFAMLRLSRRFRVGFVLCKVRRISP